MKRGETVEGEKEQEGGRQRAEDRKERGKERGRREEGEKEEAVGLTSAIVADLLDHQLVVEGVGINAVVPDGDVVFAKQLVEPLHRKVTRPVIVGILVVTEDEHGVLPPAERLLDPHAKLTQLLVGGTCVGDCRITLKADSTGTSGHHGNIPMSGESGNG